MPEVTVISFYTPTWEYPQAAARLQAQCEALEVKSYIQEVPDQGSYLANCAYKPLFIREALLHLETPVLWVDVDGGLLRHPAPGLDFSVDFMARPKQQGRPRRTRHGIVRSGSSRKWHVGTMFFNYTSGAVFLLTHWIRYLRPDQSDEAALDVAWKANIWNGTHAPLPSEYFEVIGPGWRDEPSPECIVFHRLSASPSKLQQIEQGLFRAARTLPYESEE